MTDADKLSGTKAETRNPSAIFSPEADRLAEELKLEINSNSGSNPVAVQVLREKIYVNTSWQIAALTLVGHVPESVPCGACFGLYVNAFKATLQSNVNYAYYTAPRGWWDPYQFRERMAMKILYVKTGRSYGFEAINQELLRRDPEAWLAWVNSLESPIPSLNHPAPATEKIPDQTQPPGDVPDPTQPPAKEPKEPSHKAKPYRIGAIISASLAALIGFLLLLKRRKT
jgi:hypothetical protein